MTEHYLDILQRTILENWDQPALTDFYLTDDGTAQDTSRGNRYTYGEMYAEMMRLGDLFRTLGLHQGDHIAICGSNSANWAVAYLAIAAFQGVAVTVLHTQNIEDIAYQIDFSDSICLFTDNELWEELKEQNLPQVKHVIALDDFSTTNQEPTKSQPREELMLQLQNSKLSDGKSLDDLAMICFTSGSSGVSKGVMLSYRNISNNQLDIINLYPISSNNNCISLCPFGHLSGFMADFISQIARNKNIYILPKNIITINVIHKALLLVKPYMYVSVPYVLTSLLDRYGTSLLKEIKDFCQLIFVGGAKLKEDYESEIVGTAIPLAIVYGQTETGASISISPFNAHKTKSVGKMVEGMICRISPEGEILVRGENVMLGYYKNPEATAEKIDAEGWLHTGDAGYMDEDGYLYVTGRIGQDMIVLPNGENIHPEDIESKINALPEVVESIVVARDGKLVALVRIEGGDSEYSYPSSPSNPSYPSSSLRQGILRQINPLLPDYSQLYSVEFLDQPLARTVKQTIKRYLYK